MEINLNRSCDVRSGTGGQVPPVSAGEANERWETRAELTRNAESTARWERRGGGCTQWDGKLKRNGKEMTRNSSVSGQVWAGKLINKWGRERSYEGLRVWVCKNSLTVGYQYIPVRKNCQISSMWKRSWGLKYSRAEQNGSIKSFRRPKVKTETL